MFLNGQLVNSTAAEGPIVASTRDVWLGRAPWRGLSGTLDEVRIYDRALSEDEIRLT